VLFRSLQSGVRRLEEFDLGLVDTSIETFPDVVSAVNKLEAL